MSMQRAQRGTAWLVTGDERGLLKTVDFAAAKAPTVKTHGDVRAKRVIDRLVALPLSSGWSQSGGALGAADARLACALRDGAVEVWSAARGGADARVCTRFTSARGRVVGFGPVAAVPAAAADILTCSERGEVQIWSPGAGLGDAPTLRTSFDVPGPVAAMRISPRSRAHVAFGGKTHDLSVWSIEEQKALWDAENVPDDWLDLPVPNWITDLCFMPQLAASSPPAAAATTEGASSTAAAAAASSSSSSASASASAGCAHQIVTVTSHRQIRVYDTRAQRQPVHFFDDIGGEQGNALRLVAPHPAGDSVLVSDTTGWLTRRSLSTGKLMASFKGVAGSLRSIDVAPDGKTVAAVGLDRFVHIFDLKTRKRVKKIYLKQKMNAVVHLFDALEVGAEGESDGGDAGESGGSGGGVGSGSAGRRGRKERGRGKGKPVEEDVWGMLEGAGDVVEASGPPEKKQRH